MVEGQKDDEARRLLTGALQVWRLEATVSDDGDGGFLVAMDDTTATVQRRDDGGWNLSVGARETRYAGVPGLLRGLHAALDPDDRPVRFRIAPGTG